MIDSIVAAVRWLLEFLVLSYRSVLKRREEKERNRADDWERRWQKAVLEGDTEALNVLLNERRRVDRLSK